MRLKKITNNTNIKNYKININLSSYFKNTFCVGDTIQNKEDKTLGVIDKIKNGTIYVKYKDNTIERINELNAKDVIEFADIPEDDLIPEISKEVAAKEATRKIQHKKVSGHGLKELDFTQDIPIDKLAEQQYKQLKQQSDAEKKQQLVKNIINLGIQKGIIDKDEYDLEVLKASSMTDEDFEDYKNEILNFNSQSIVSSNMQEETENLSEAELMLKRVKSGTIETAGNVDFSNIHSDTRNLSDIKQQQPIQRPIITPAIAPIEASQGFNKYSWIDNIEWTMGSR